MTLETARERIESLKCGTTNPYDIAAFKIALRVMDEALTVKTQSPMAEWTKPNAGCSCVHSSKPPS